ncbi:unnamed protein product [Dibothriocephalus latus]|uniref:Uncharacterized protein n=1 Tax=Dibothriocephalus latus TaxID=60516 RepID=A0A3P7LI95_DIBLA|nr:unnamed protein product [Dibothriocephalus latus]
MEAVLGSLPSVYLLRTEWSFPDPLPPIVKCRGLAVRRGYALSQVAAHTYETGHDFNFAAARIITHAGIKTDRELNEACASNDNSVNRCIELAPAYAALRRYLQTHGTGG